MQLSIFKDDAFKLFFLQWKGTGKTVSLIGKQFIFLFLILKEL